MGDEFESWMGKMGVSSKGSSKKRSQPSSKKTKRMSPRDRHLAATKGPTHSSNKDPLSMGLEEIVQSSELEKLKEELAKKEAQLRALQESLQEVELEKKKLLEINEQKESQLKLQETSIKELAEAKVNGETILQELNTLLLEAKQSHIGAKQAWQREKKELQEEQARLLELKPQPSGENKEFLISLLEKRGIVVREEQLQALRSLTENANFGGCFQTIEVEKQPVQQFLEQELHLIGEHVQLSSLISGTVISVPAERCELTGGLDLEYATREIITEMLMGGFKKLALIGTPKAYGGLLRELFTHESIVVSVLGSGDVENLASYDIIAVLNDLEAQNLSTEQNVLIYSLEKQSIGAVLLEISREIPEIHAKF